MQPGDIVAGRFEIERHAGSGGMGSVWRARDRQRGDAVALKVVQRDGPEAIERLGREARLLEELDHPGIVRHVAHGDAGGGGFFLAMEWLDGEDLSRRLARSWMTVAESVALVGAVADALAEAHRRGVVHRDIKPGNLFLQGGELARVRIIDFGIARARDARELTITGAMVGTPGYMAPEQARCDRRVDARADIFSLGCVLFKCVVGRGPFEAEDVLTVLLKIVLDPAPRLLELAPGISPALDDLVARMLSKAPEGRPADAAVLADELRALGDLGDPTTDVASTGAPATGPSSVGFATPTSSSFAALTSSEQRLLCVVLAGGSAPADDPPTLPADVPAETLRRAGLYGPSPSEAPGPLPPEDRLAFPAFPAPGALLAPPPGALHAPAPPSLRAKDALERVRTAVVAYGARSERLADGSIALTLTGTCAATDQAARAARAALAVRALFDGAPMALAIGRGDASASPRIRPRPVADALAPESDRAHGSPVRSQRGAHLPGNVIERAAKLLAARHGDGARGIALDEVTAGLLDARFMIGGNERGLELLGEREVVQTARTLLGTPTPCVGRERELRSLLAIFDECADDSVAHVVLVTAAAGVGKSRLCQELLGALRRRGEPPLVVMARGDPVSAGSPFGLIAPATRRAVGVLEGEPLAVRQHKIRARVARHVPEPDRARIGEFLGELLGTPFPDEHRRELRGARADPILMGDQMSRAWQDWLEAECDAQPVILVMEDLHWGDLPSVTFVDAALRVLRKKPLMVLALARPEVHTLFPELWAGRGLTRMELGELSPRASAQLVRRVLGAEVPEATVARLVEQSGGNAFYLEELVRAAAEGKGDAPPGTILAMVQSRIEALAPESRRVLRAASVFGQVFWEGGAHALVAGYPLRLREQLGSLVDREIIARRGLGDFAGEEEYAFCSALVRDAAYGMLTDADRALGHQLAGAWLERVGESEAVVIADHYERGGEALRAVALYRRAAEQALEGNDYAAALGRTERAIACGAEAEELGALRLLQAEAHFWRGDNVQAEASAERAVELLARGSPPWCFAVVKAATTSLRLGHHERAVELAEALLERLGEGEVSNELLITAAPVAANLYLAGRREVARALLERIEATAQGRGDDDPRLSARIYTIRAQSSFNAGNPGDAVEILESAAREFDRAGDARNGCLVRVTAGYGRLELGAHDEAEALLRQALATAERMGLGSARAVAKHNLGLALAHLGRLHEAQAEESEAALLSAQQRDRRMEGGSRAYLAMILLRMADHDAAEREARAAVELAGASAGMRAGGLAVLAQVLLASGRVSEALAAAEEAAALLELLGEIGDGEALVRLSLAESQRAAGAIEASVATITHARRRLLARADAIREPRWRESFLGNVPENARTMALARDWRDSVAPA